jgi:hemolysin type calcium-binding protein
VFCPKVKRAGKLIWLGIWLAAAFLALPSFAAADASISRSGNKIKLTSDGDGDEIHYAGTDYLRVISFYVEPGHVLRAGAGCHRLRGPRVTKVIVACGAPSLKENDGNHVTMHIDLGGGDDFFNASPYSDVQPRIVADGGDGNDRIVGSVNSDDISGGAGDDRIEGGEDVDNLDGGEGNDIVIGGSGDDALQGGGGVDQLYGDGLKPISTWGNDIVISALDFTPDFTGFLADTVNCGEGGYDSAVVDDVDSIDPNCENLSGGRSTPPRDTTGTLPLSVSIDGPVAAEGDFRDIVRGTPVRVPMTFSAAATINSTLTVSSGFALRHHLPDRVIARGIGTPLVLTPITLNSQIRLLWKVRPALVGLSKVAATLKVTGTGSDGSRDTAVKSLVLR